MGRRTKSMGKLVRFWTLRPRYERNARYAEGHVMAVMMCATYNERWPRYFRER